MKPKTEYSIIIVALLAISAVALGAVVTPQGAEPDPWWLHVEKIQDLLMKWIGAATIVLTAVIGLIFTVWALINSKIKEIKDRQDRAAATDKHLQDQVTAVAIQTPPNPEPPAK